MNAQECLQILRKVKDTAFATVDEKGMPQVRIIDVMLVEKGKLYFCTARGKEFHRQLREREDVAVAGMNREYQMVRLWGKAVRLENQKAWIDRIFKENPSMEEVYPGETRYILEAFCIEKMAIEFFDLGKIPIQRENFVIGKEQKRCTGFEITKSCIGCGVCAENCPQQCIREGIPFLIQQENCLHCGLCMESCPVQAVRRRGE